MDNMRPGVEVKNRNSRCWPLLDPTDALIAASLKPFDAQICKQIELFEDNMNVGFFDRPRQSRVHRKTVGLRCSNCDGEKSASRCFVSCAMDMAPRIRQLYETHVRGCGMTLSFEDTKPCEKACSPQLFNPTDTTAESLSSSSLKSLSLDDFCIFRCQELSLFDLMPKIPPALAKNDTSGVLNHEAHSDVSTKRPYLNQEPTPFTEEILSPPQMHSVSCEIRNFFSPHILLSPRSLNLQNSPSAVTHLDPNLLLSPHRPSGGLFNHIPAQQAAFPSFPDVAPEAFMGKLQHQILPRSHFFPVSQRSATPYQTPNHPGLHHLAGAGDSIHQREVFTPKTQDDQPRLLPRTRNQTTAFHPFRHQLLRDIHQEDQYCPRKLQSIEANAVPKRKSSVFNNMLHSIPSHVRDAIAQLTSTSTLGDKYPDGTPVPENFKLICGDDHQLLSFYQFHIMKQLRHCHFKEEDRMSKGGHRRLMKIGFGGLECVHCAPCHLPRRFFWRECKRLADSFSEISDHATSCRACPGPIKKALLTLKDYHEEQKKRKEIRHGSRTIFFRKLWKRIHQDDPEIAGTEDDTTSSTTKMIKEPSRNGPKGPSLLRNTIPKERSHANSHRQSVANNSFLSITSPSLRLLPRLQPEANPGHTEPSNDDNEEGCIKRTVSTAESDTTAETATSSEDSTWRTSVSSPSPNMMAAAPPLTAGDFSPFSKNVEEQKRFLCRTPPPFLPSHATTAPPPLPWIITTPKSTNDSDEKEEDAASCTSTLASSSSSWCSHNLHHHYRTRSVMQKRNTRKKHTMKKPPSESSSSRNPSQLAKSTIGAKKSPRRKPSSSEEAIPRMTTRSFAARGSYMVHDTDAGAAAAMVRPRAGAYKDVSSLSSATSRQTASCGCCRCHCT